MSTVEEIFDLNKNLIASKEDVVIALIHSVLISKDYDCIGLGVDKICSPAVQPSPLLPIGWNSNQTFYAIRYISKFNNIVILQGIAIGSNDLSVELKSSVKSAVANFHISDCVLQLNGANIDDYFVNLNHLKSKFVDLIKNVEPMEEKQYGSTSQNWPKYPKLPNFGQKDLDPFPGKKFFE